AQGVRDLTRIADGDPRLWWEVLSRITRPVADVLDAVAADLTASAVEVRVVGGVGPGGGALEAVVGLLGRGARGRGRVAGKHGRDVFMQLSLAAGNSILIAFAVTTIIALIGITLGLIAGYYGGQVDNVIMRVTDFVMTLPTTMIIIVFLVVVPEYTITSFIFI